MPRVGRFRFRRLPPAYNMDVRPTRGGRACRRRRTMRASRWRGGRAVAWVALLVLVASGRGRGEAPEASPGDATRGREALTGRSFLSPAWTESAYAKAGSLWGTPAPDPAVESE